MTSLTDLIERVRSGSGEDRELDADLHLALRSAPDQFKMKDGWIGVGAYNGFASTRLTTSLDAVVRLVEEKLPGWHLTEMRTPDPTSAPFNHASAKLVPDQANDYGWDDVGIQQDEHKTDLTRAVLLCLLLALQAQEGTDG